ncbi:hypothetical protein [Flavobacterium sp. F52]|uniref:hypothetical protein n=1 Tax=Flavobacterium sp. F52 TaxID=1202532 RepID=UPI000272DF76|nr:hypothetical protein [Flavobacterium sp. F52]EJG03399.1 hypothetical protein FF52_00580 [Flavobacterium sp. F52]
MDKERIKDELIREGEFIINSISNPVKRASGFDKLKALGNHLKTTDDFTQKLTAKLNEILEANEISFEGENGEVEKNELIEYLKPTITELIRKYLGL